MLSDKLLLSIHLLFICWLAILGKAVLRAEEDESARHYVEYKCEADPKSGEEDRSHRLNTPETVLLNCGQLFSNFDGLCFIS